MILCGKSEAEKFQMIVRARRINRGRRKRNVKFSKYIVIFSNPFVGVIYEQSFPFSKKPVI